MTKEANKLEKQSEHIAKPRKKRRKRPFLLRVFFFLTRSVFLIVLLLLIVVALSGWYFLGTNNGAKQLIALGNQFTDFDIQADGIDGRLGETLTLTNVRVKGEPVDVRAKKAILSWSPKQLLSNTLHLKQLRVEDADMTVVPSEDDTEKDDNAQPPTLKDVKLPIGVVIDDISVSNIRIIQAEPDKTTGEIIKESLDEKGKIDDEAVKDVAKNTGKKVAKKVLATKPADTPKSTPVFVIDDAKLSAQYIDGAWKVTDLTFANPDISTRINAIGKTTGDYPIALATNTTISVPEVGEVKVNSTVEGSVGEQLQLVTKLAGAADANLVVSVANVLTDAPTGLVALDIQRVDFVDLGKRNDTTIPLKHLSGRITAQGGLADLRAKLDLRTTHNEFGDIRAIADVSGEPLKQLTANVTTTGFVDAALVAEVSDFIAANGGTPNPTFAAKLDVTRLSQQLLQTEEATDVSGTITATGTIEDLAATLEASAQSSRLGKVNASTRAHFDGKAISVRDLLIALPETKQQITGQADVDLATEKLNATLQSTLFTFPQNAPEVTAKNLDVRVDGTLSDYTADIRGDVRVKDVPPLSINATAKGDQTQLTDSDITVKLLGGTVQSKGSVVWTPSLRVATNITAKNIQPQQFFPEIKANLNSDLSLNVTQADDELAIVADLSSLSGTLRGQPVRGKGKVMVNDDVVNIDQLDVDLAGNRVLANGKVSAQALDLTYDINAKSLQKILPDLRGAVSGKGTLKGSPQKPNVNATLSATNVGYQTYRVGKADIRADVDLAKNRLNINAKTADLTLDKEKIQSATLAVKGTFAQHDLATDLVSAARTASIRAKGGFDLDKQSWQGTVNRIEADEKALNKLGQWQTQNAFQLAVSPEQVDIRKLCLVQPQKASAVICADGGLRDQFKNGTIDVTLKNVRSTLFKDYLPKEIKLDNTFSGDAAVQLKKGKPFITGTIKQNKTGKLTLATGNSPFKDQIQTLNLDFALKDQAISAKANLKLKKLGQADIDAGLPNLSNGKFSTRLRLDMPSLKPLENFVPDLANLKGSINGDIAIKGTTAGQFNATGDIKLNKTRFDVPAYGTQIRDLQLTISAGNNNQLLFNGSAQGGKGKLVISGSANPLKQTGKINIKGKNFRVAKSAQYFVELSPNMDVVIGEKLKIRGELGVPTAVISPSGGSGKSKVTTSSDVIDPRKKKQKPTSSSPVDVDLTVKLGGNVRVNAQDISMGLGGDMNVKVKPNQSPKGSGTVTVQTGRYRFYGQELDIKRGRVIFSGALDNPSLDINAERDIEDADATVVAGVNILGSAQTPRISLYSRPGLSDADILSYLVFGRKSTSENFAQSVALQAAGAAGTSQVSRGIKDSTGLDVFDLTLSGLEVGKNLSKKAYVGYKRNFFSGINELIGKYHIKSCLKAEAKYSTGTDTGFDFICAFESD